jgi:hypothetical protein
MKLNVKNIRYLTPDDWRTLPAVCASFSATWWGTNADEEIM